MTRPHFNMSYFAMNILLIHSRTSPAKKNTVDVYIVTTFFLLSRRSLCFCTKPNSSLGYSKKRKDRICALCDDV